MLKTKYYGIYIEYDRSQNCWWIFDSNGDAEDFDHIPSGRDIDSYRNRVTENGTIFYR